MRALALLLALALACGDDDAGTPDAAAPLDAALDAALDSSTPDDAAADAGDPEDDAGADAGPEEPIDPVAGAGTVETVASAYMGEDFGFLEGPHWIDDHLVFSDLIFSSSARQTIYALGADDALSIVVRPSEGANGNGTHPDGTHITCLQGGRRLAEVTPGGELITRIERYEGQRINATHDLVFRSDGLWYFTDPGYGVNPGDREIDAHGLYLVAGDTLTRVWTGTTTQRPNGVVLSPDEATLYLADTADGVVRAFDVAADGTLSGERTFAGDTAGADGMTIDAAGNLYVTTNVGVRVFAPDGSEWGTLAIPMQPANAAFGGADGRTLYVTARTTLYRVPMPIPGL